MTGTGSQGRRTPPLGDCLWDLHVLWRLLERHFNCSTRSVQQIPIVLKRHWRLKAGLRKSATVFKVSLTSDDAMFCIHHILLS